jgi:hypothetical protein
VMAVNRSSSIAAFNACVRSNMNIVSKIRLGSGVGPSVVLMSCQLYPRRAIEAPVDLWIAYDIPWSLTLSHQKDRN